MTAASASIGDPDAAGTIDPRMLREALSFAAATVAALLHDTVEATPTMCADVEARVAADDTG